ncbi:TadE/TadG family type IV pilus assembly protein [Cutibacterium granulosum]|uniref:TadE/TadG family type IV pilus assembly protein n=1 Tax=Cutibacterium granulosum TaxID=33011 RepID=UPI002B229129|nr:TadE/TadG family type IV pilus assembly protein [Cutibacterium granulosum]MEA5638440.1 TadE/TadG family type IV pilus assembly protein [Cutibacterium granulosum]
MSARTEFRHLLRDDRGGAAIECIGLLPLFLISAIAAIQIGLAGWASVETEYAARDAARAATLGQDSTAAAQASLTGRLHVQSMSVGGADSCRVKLTVRVPSLVGFQMGTVTRTAEMPRLHP